MAKLARDLMTTDPACCSPDTRIDKLAKLMVDHDCGEIPIVDGAKHPVGVVTDRDIVCRIVAEGRNPSVETAEKVMNLQDTRRFSAAGQSWYAACAEKSDLQGECKRCGSLAWISVRAARERWLLMRMES